uniref:Ig-like domain-containing protein n=2 Tax=Bos TaxID=9903 RepID=A0A4W2EPZ9_BOBOX
MLLIAPVLILWMQIPQVNGQQISQIPQFLPLQEGENFTMYCNSSSILSSLQWYKQRPGGSPVFLMILAKGGEVKTEQRLTGRLGETRKHGSLHLAAAQLSDAGTYFYAGHSALEAPAVCPQTSLWATGVTLPHLSSGQGPEKAEVTISIKKLNF